MTHTISIITVCFNAAATIGDCLDSVGGQSVAAEHVVVDGVSTDGTLEILRKREGHGLRVVSEPDAGIYDAMNKGVALATGEVVGILNADDVYAGPQVLARVAEVFRDPSVEACYGDLVYVDPEDTDRVLRYWRSGTGSPEKFRWGWMPPHPTFFVRRSVYERYGLFSLDLGSAADYELMLRFLVGHRIAAVYIPEVLVRMRTGGMSNASVKNRLKANRMDRRAWRVNALRPYFWTFLMKPLRKLPQYWAKVDETF